MRAAVTGASGFLGGALARALQAEGANVVALARRAMPELERLGARTLQFDLASDAGLARALDGVEVVFHVAAKTGVWGPRSEYVASNVTATENVLAACRAAGVPRLVFTSSPSVTFDGRDQLRASNDLPYARRFCCAYPETKAAAERLALAANDTRLATCALRPHLIFGADDPHLIPRIVERARSGRLARVGDGTNEVTLCALESAVHAHLLAAKTLSSSAPHAGRAYFVGQEEPLRLWSWIDELLQALGLPRVRRSVPLGVAYCAGAACELVWGALGRSREPPMTRFVALQLGRSHSYDMAPARRDFGYREALSSASALERVVARHRAR